MKYIIFLLFLSFSINTSFSQTTHFLSLGPDLGIPAKNLKGANLGWGGSLEYQLKFSAPLGVQLHAGYSSFSSQGLSNVGVRFLPVRAGVVGYLYEDIIFVSADAGISRYHAYHTGTKQPGFSFGAGAGYRYTLGNSMMMQLSAYYNLHNYKRAQSTREINYNWINIRAAFGLVWGKGKKRVDDAP